MNQKKNTAHPGSPADLPTVMGHPKGLLFLAFTEAWERFSYYGMVALIVLYMADQLLLPGHVEHIAGFATFRAMLESMFGPMSALALGSQIFGLYTGLVYFTPVLGGIIADRWLGQRNAVVIGAVLMSAGQIAMAFDETFLLALLLLVVGSGFLKGNISAQVGALYPREDEARRSHGFVIFSTGINVGSVVGPLVCGLLAQIYGWHVGFGTAGVFMLGGLATYLYGYRYLPARVPRRAGSTQAASAKLTAADWRAVRALVVVMLITIFQSVAYYQVGNALPLWVEAHVGQNIGGLTFPIPWYQSIDPLVSIVAVPLVLLIWKRQASGGAEPDDLDKIRVGSWIAAASNLLLVAAIALAGDTRINPLWPFLYCTGLGIAFLYYWPTLLALVSRVAPARMNATLMSAAFLTLTLANFLIGWLGGFYERITPSEFWLMHAGIGATGGVLVLLFGSRLRAALAAGVNS